MHAQESSGTPSKVVTGDQLRSFTLPTYTRTPDKKSDGGSKVRSGTETSSNPSSSFEKEDDRADEDSGKEKTAKSGLRSTERNLTLQRSGRKEKIFLNFEKQRRKNFPAKNRPHGARSSN